MVRIENTPLTFDGKPRPRFSRMRNLDFYRRLRKEHIISTKEIAEFGEVSGYTVRQIRRMISGEARVTMRAELAMEFIERVGIRKAQSSVRKPALSGAAFRDAVMAFDGMNLRKFAGVIGEHVTTVERYAREELPVPKWLHFVLALLNLNHRHLTGRSWIVPSTAAPESAGWVTINEAARRLGVAKNTVYKALEAHSSEIRQRKVPSRGRLGHAVKVPWEELLAVVRNDPPRHRKLIQKEEGWVTAMEAAELYGVSVDEIHRLVRGREITKRQEPHAGLRGYIVRMPWQELQELVQKHRHWGLHTTPPDEEPSE